MVDYAYTKIYYIQVGDKRYYGHSAHKYITTRQTAHRGCLKRGCQEHLYKRMREIGMTEQDVKCVVVEHYPCQSKYEAMARERYWIEKDGGINIRLPTRKFNEWYKTNHKSQMEYRKKYREANQEKMKQWSADWYERNKEKAKAKAKEWKKNNKDRIKELAQEQVVCDICGKSMSKYSIRRHMRTIHPQ